MNMNADIDILLANYFSGEALAKELDMLDDWLAQSEENQTYFDQMTALFEKTGFVAQRQPDVAKALGKFEQYIQQSEGDAATVQPLKSVKTKKLSVYLRVAAVFVALIGLSALFYYYNGSQKSTQVIASTTPIQYIMPDSSIIQLGENSEVSFNQSDGMNVKLTGKAVFDVSKNSKGKFLVNAGETFVKDIGTVFTVIAYPNNEQVIVTVESGMVIFYTATDVGIELVAGETGIFNRKTKTFEKQTPEGNLTNQNLIVFDSTPLSEVKTLLAQQYGVPIEIENSIANRQITVSFERNESIDDILHIIAETLSLNIRLTNGIYTLSARK